MQRGASLQMLRDRRPRSTVRHRRFVMLRCFRVSIGLVVALGMAGSDARRSGLRSRGWGGWGTTSAVGDAARGAGMYAIGAGVYNLDTAQARSINANTSRDSMTMWQRLR